MKVLMVNNGHIDVTLPLVRELSERMGVTLNIQIEENTLRESIFDYTLQSVTMGVPIEDTEIDRIRRDVRKIVGGKPNVIFSKYRFRSFRDFHNWKVSWEWARWVHKQKFDLVHYIGTSMPFFQQNLLDQFSRKVFTVHDHVQHLGEYSRGATLYLRYMAKRSGKHRFIAQSDFVRRGFIKEYGVRPDQVTTVRYGALDLYKKWEDPSVKEEPNTVLFFGRISPYKGLEYLAEAWQVIRMAKPHARLIIAGGGRFYFDAHALRTDDRVEIHNKYIDNPELVRFIQRASIVVLPYVEATQSGVVMTAYAFNKPVVATNVGALPEVVEDSVTGYLVPPRDPVALANAIVDLLEKPARRAAFAKAIGEKVRNELSWERIAEQTIEVYRSCLM